MLLNVDLKNWTDGDVIRSHGAPGAPECVEHRPGRRDGLVYSDSAANAASRTCSTGPTPEILRYFGAPGRPDLAHLP